MAIGNIQGFNPYAADRSLQTDNSTIAAQNREAALDSDLSEANAQTARQAFQVDITQEARDRQAEEAATETGETPEEVPMPEPRQEASQQSAQYGAASMVNIVA